MNAKETVSAGGVIFNQKREMLVVNQQGKTWSLPKGHVEVGESLIDAAKREIYEETGITQLELIGELGAYTRYRLDKHGNEDKSEHKTIHLFMFRTTQTDTTPIDPENPEMRWTTLDGAISLITRIEDKRFLEQHRNEIEREQKRK